MEDFETIIIAQDTYFVVAGSIAEIAEIIVRTPSGVSVEFVPSRERALSLVAAHHPEMPEWTRSQHTPFAQRRRGELALSSS